MYSKGDAVHIVGMVVRVALFILEVAEVVQACHKRCTYAVVCRDLDKVFYDIDRREGYIYGRERS